MTIIGPTGSGDDGPADAGVAGEEPRPPASRRAFLVSYGLLIAAAIAAVSAASIWIAGRPSPERVEVFMPTPAPPAPVTVHVVGAVREPGVYTLAPGARVDDAVTAAGLLPHADVHALNLAASLADGARIDVPAEPQSATRSETSASVDEPTVVHLPTATPAPGLVDLNTATAEQLQLLDGIGPVRAQAIIDYREEFGPIEYVDDLLDIPGIGPATVAGVRRHVVQQ